MRLPIVTLVLLLLLLSAALFPRGWRTTPVTAQAPMPPTRTAIQHFLPWAPDAVAPGLMSTGIIPGNCWTGSLQDHGNPDAWRCSGDNNEIYDPCFTNPYPTTMPNVLACATSPFAAAVVLFSTAPLPTAMANQLNMNALPWALVLANGAQCTAAPGTSTVIAGLRVNYTCDDGGSVLGDPQRPGPLWWVWYIPAAGGPSTINVDVVTAWY